MNSVISDSIISRSSEVVGGRLGSCEIKDSTLNSSCDHNSSISACKIDSSKLYFSRLHACYLSQDTKRVVKPLSTFRRFPPEIRRIIFKFCKNTDKPDSRVPDIPYETGGQVPTLVVALRGDQVLYHEALEAMHENGVIHLQDVPKLNNAQLRFARTLILV